MEFPDAIKITPVGKIDASIRAPPSKAYTLRAIFLSALASGKSILKNPLLADDQLAAIEAMKSFGATFEKRGDSLGVIGAGGHLIAPKIVNSKESGVSMRFLAAIAGIAGKGGEEIIIDGSERMKQRPIGDLVESMVGAGAKAECVNGNNCPPVRVIGKSLQGGKISVKADKSSQFVSALLIALPLAKQDSEISVQGEIKSAPYIGITAQCVRDFGGKIEALGDGMTYSINGGQSYESREIRIEGDFSSASFLFEAVAICGGRLVVENLNRDSLQGDKAFLDFIERMGCDVTWQEGSVTVESSGVLSPIDADLSDSPDIVMPLAVVCAFAMGKSILRGVKTLKFKESDRVQSTISELDRLGVDAGYDKRKDALIVNGFPEKIHGNVQVETYNDHRISMSFAVAGLKLNGISINNPGCVKKSFPDFFDVIAELGKGKD